MDVDAALLHKVLVEFAMKNNERFWSTLERAAQEFGPSNQSAALPHVEFNLERAEREISFA